MIIIFSSAIFCGQFIVSIGCSIKDFNMILFGRFIFGLGGESLMVSIVTLLTSWFEGKELAFSLGLMLFFARIGSAGNAWLSPSIAIYKGVSIVFWFGTLLCFFAFISTLFVVVLDQVFKSPYETHEIEYEDSEIMNEIEDNLDSDDSNPTTSSTPSDIYPDEETYQNTLLNTSIGQIPLSELPPLKLTEYPGPQDELHHHHSSSTSSSSSQHHNIHFRDEVEYQEFKDNTSSDNISNATNDDNNNNSSINNYDIDEIIPIKDESYEENLQNYEGVSQENSPREYFTLEDLQSRKKPLWPPQKNISFWLVISCCSFIYGTIIPFITISNEVIRVAYYGRQSEKHEIAVEYVVAR